MKAFERNIISQVLFRFFPYWPIFILFIGASCVAAWYYISTLAPLYEASASILIKDKESGTGNSKIMESIDLLSSSKNIQNEIEVIQSRSLMKEVVTRLHLYAPLFEEGNDKLYSAYASSPILVIAEDPENLKEKPKESFSYNAKENTVIINHKSYPIGQWHHTIYGKIKFEKNPHQTTNAKLPLAFALAKLNNVVNQLRGSLSAMPIGKTSMVVLKFKDPVAQKAEDVLNTLADAYKKSSLNEKSALASNTLSFVEDRIKYVENDLDSLEKKIQAYKKTKGVSDLSVQGNIYLDKLNDNDEKSANLRIQLASLNQVEDYLNSKKDKGGLVPVTKSVGDPILLDLLQKLYNYEMEYDRLRKSTEENHPYLLTLKSQIDKIRPSLLENISNQKKALTTTINKVDGISNSYTSKLSTLPQKEKELLDLNRQQAIKSSVYTFLLQKREETALSHSATVADNRLIDMAESYMMPIKPSKHVVYILAIAFGLLLGIGVVTARDTWNTKVLFRSEIESATKLPVIAELSYVKSKNPIIVNQLDKPFILEQFRHIRSALGLYSRYNYKRRIMITSSISGEGKSFVSVNLALSLAMAGKKVVLIDLDLRSPRTSEIFNVKAAEGVSEYLEGDKEIIEVIKQTAFENLSIVPAGNSDITTIELLLGGKLNELFTFLNDRFDYIISDTSPIDPVTDASVLSDYFNTTLFVVRHGYTPKTLIHLLDENQKVKVLKNTAIVFNGVRQRGFMRKGYGYGYGYGYDYAYRDKEYKMKNNEVHLT